MIHVDHVGRTKLYRIQLRVFCVRMPIARVRCYLLEACLLRVSDSVSFIKIFHILETPEVAGGHCAVTQRLACLTVRHLQCKALSRQKTALEVPQ